MFNDVDECDLLAAHPADPERLADGVADGTLVPRLAVKACEAAVKQNSKELRFAYQLGRAYLAANRKDNAAEQFKRAADGNYAAAFAAQAELVFYAVRDCFSCAWHRLGARLSRGNLYIFPYTGRDRRFNQHSHPGFRMPAGRSCRADGHRRADTQAEHAHIH